MNNLIFVEKAVGFTLRKTQSLLANEKAMKAQINYPVTPAVK